MIVGATLSTLIIGGAAYLGNTVIPAIWHNHTIHPTKVQVQQAKELMEHGDPEAQKIQALQGMQPVYSLKATPIQKPELIGPPDPQKDISK